MWIIFWTIISSQEISPTLYIEGINFNISTLQLERIEDFFLPYPGMYLKEGVVYFHNTPGKIFFNKIPLSSTIFLSHLFVDKVEVIHQPLLKLNSSSSYCVNFLPKKLKEKSSVPHSRIKIIQNPDIIGFEFGRKLLKDWIELYFVGETYSTFLWNSRLRWENKIGSVDVYYVGVPILDINIKKGRIAVSKEYSLVEFYFKKMLTIGIEGFNGGFVTLSNEIFKLWFSEYTLRYNRVEDKISHQLSFSYIPIFGCILYTSITNEEITVGGRVLNSRIWVAKKKQESTPTFGGAIISPIFFSTQVLGGFLLDDGKYFYNFLLRYRNSLHWEHLILSVGIGIFRGFFFRCSLTLISASLLWRNNTSPPHCYGIDWEFKD
jgi:hypothetical protein